MVVSAPSLPNLRGGTMYDENRDEWTIPNGIGYTFQNRYKAIRSTVAGATLVVAILLLIFQVSIYIGDVQSRVDQTAQEYTSLHWRAVDAKIVDLGPVTGNVKPTTQSATVEYPQGEINQRLNLNVQLGYHQNDLVQLYVNDKGQNMFRTYYADDPTHFDTGTQFIGDFFTTTLLLILFYSLIAWCISYLLIINIVNIVYRRKTTNELAAVTS